MFEKIGVEKRCATKIIKLYGFEKSFTVLFNYLKKCSKKIVYFRINREKTNGYEIEKISKFL
jgi:hypothetical protein